MKVTIKASKISQNSSVQATTTRHFLTPDQNRENYDSKVVQVVLTRSYLFNGHTPLLGVRVPQRPGRARASVPGRVTRHWVPREHARHASLIDGCQAHAVHSVPLHGGRRRRQLQLPRR